MLKIGLFSEAVLDINQKLVFKNEYKPSGSQSLDVSRLESGVYIILALADGKNIDLAGIFKTSTGPETFCQKLFVKSAGEVSLSTADATECFNMKYDPEALPWLGLWVNKNAWSGCGSKPYLNLGLEPTTAPHDFLTEAVAQGHANVLQAGESKSWSLSVHLKNGSDTHE